MSHLFLQADPVLSAELLSTLRALGSVCTYRRRETIFREGYPHEKVWLVLRGFVRLTQTDRDGRRTVVAFRRPGDFFGISDEGFHLNTASAVTDVRLGSFDPGGFRAALLRVPGLQYSLFRKAVADLLQARKHATLITRQPASRRLAGFLLELARYPECFEPQSSTLDLPVDRADIAGYLGLTIETVSRAFTELSQRLHIQRISSRRVRLEMSTLERYTHMEEC